MCFVLTLLAIQAGIIGLWFSKDNDDTFKRNIIGVYAIYSLALGDSNYYFNYYGDDNITEYPKKTLYIYYFLATLVLTIIMLNLLITILSEGYEIVKEKERNLVNEAYLSLDVEAISKYHVFENHENKKKKSTFNYFVDLIIIWELFHYVTNCK